MNASWLLSVIRVGRWPEGRQFLRVVRSQYPAVEGGPKLDSPR